MSTFSRLLVAKYFPKNRCYVADGIVLYVRPAPTLPSADHVSHEFVSTADRTTWSRYGWVREVEPFSMGGFLSSYLEGEAIDDAMREHLRIMLSSIAKLAPDTPVAATYSRRGVEMKEVEFEVHRVVFFGKMTAR